MPGNEAGLVPRLNLKGYILGCPRIDALINENSKLIFSHRIGLVSDEIYDVNLNAYNWTLSSKLGFLAVPVLEKPVSHRVY